MNKKMVQRAYLTQRLSIKTHEEGDKLKDIERILSALSNEDALKIFKMAGEGITSSIETIKKLGLTQKRYYTRLSELLETKLIQKDDGVYKHTVLGSIVYKIIDYLNEVIDKGEQLELIDKVKRSKTLSQEDKDRILQAITEDSIGEFLGLIDGGIRLGGIVFRFENIVRGVVDLIKRAEEEIYLVTRYTESEVVEEISKRLDEEIRFYCISSDKRFFSRATELLRIILARPALLKAYYKIFNSSDVYIGFMDNIPYSFIVVDKRWVGLEVPNPQDNSFFMGLFFENETLAGKLIEVFNLMKSRAEENTKGIFLKEILEKVKTFSI